MTNRPIRATLLAAKLAEQLAAVVPDEAEVSVAGSVISLRMRGTPWGMDADLRPPPEEPAYSELHEGIQQEIVEWDEVRPEDLPQDSGPPTEAWRAIASTGKRPAVIDIERLPGTLEATLDQLQDVIAEIAAEPWPAVAPDPMPAPFVQLRDGRLVAGYGDPADPALLVLSAVLQDLC